MASPEIKKRKAQATDDDVLCLGSSTDLLQTSGASGSSANKKPKLDVDYPVAFNLKTRGLVFRNPQKSLELTELKEGLNEKMEWCEWLEARKGNPITEFPTEHLPLLARCVEESDLTIGKLINFVHKTLLKGIQEPEGSKTSILPISVLKSVIETFFERVNYGLDADHSSSSEKVKSFWRTFNIGDKDIPEKIKIWRWKARPKYRKGDDKDILPKESREKLINRIEEREMWKNAIEQQFEALDAESQLALFGLVEEDKGKGKEAVVHLSDSERDEGVKHRSSIPTAETSAKKNSRKKKEDGDLKPEERAKKEEKEEKKRKAEEKRKLKEERAAKVETEKRQQSNFFSAFLQKAGSSSSGKKTLTIKNEKPNDIKKESEFDKTFKKFFVKDSVIMGTFRTLKDSPRKIEVLDQDGDVKMEVVDNVQITPEESLRQLKLQRRTKYKSRIVHSVRVADIYQKAAEAHAFGDIDTYAIFAKQLKDRTLFPLKYFDYYDRIKPGFYGTWTKTIDSIRPRRPLFKDPTVYNYDYDSDDDYDPDNEGEGEQLDGDAEEIASNSEGEEGTEADDEMADWMVDDDVVEYEPGFDATDDIRWNKDDKDDISRFMAENTRRKKEKREAMERKRKDAKINKLNLQPVIKGLLWETVLGEAGEFDAFKLEFINDAYCNIDPFTFVSQSILPITAPPPSVKAESTGSLPLPNANEMTIAPKQRGTVATLAAPHMPVFVSVVSGSDKNKEVLVDQIKDALKDVKGVTKRSIEATLKDCAVKLKKSEGGKWRVNDDILRMYPILQLATS